jgi:hypothetical protein
VAHARGERLLPADRGRNSLRSHSDPVMLHPDGRGRSGRPSVVLPAAACERRRGVAVNRTRLPGLD